MTNTAQSLSDALAAAVEKAAQSVARVDARNHIPASGIVWSADGEILTADHVVRRDENITVTLPDGSDHQAKILGRDPRSDLALLKVDTKGLTVPEFNESLNVGHLVFAVGRPDTVQASLGNVVSVELSDFVIELGPGGEHGPRRRRGHAFIQSDVTMYPGFSGGPLADASGRVAGINSSALARGASLSLPVATARAVADALRKDGRVKRGYIGIGTQPVALADDVAAKLDQRTGLMLINVEKDSPAAKGGLLQGDVLVGLAGRAVHDIEDLQMALGPETVGKGVVVKVVRGGEVKEMSVMVGVRE